MAKTVRLTMAQALVRFLLAQKTEIDGVELPIFAGVWGLSAGTGTFPTGASWPARRQVGRPTAMAMTHSSFLILITPRLWPAPRR